MKRFIILAMICVMFTFFACGGDGKEQQKVKIKLNGPAVITTDRADKVEASKWLEEDLKKAGLDPDHMSMKKIFELEHEN